jgi:hypothetical protein
MVRPAFHGRFSLETVAAVFECRQRARASMSPEQGCAAGNYLIRGEFGFGTNKLGFHEGSLPQTQLFDGAICLDRVVPRRKRQNFLPAKPSATEMNWSDAESKPKWNPHERGCE